MTYFPKTVYHKQGSTELVCSSGATITIQNGGNLAVSSGGKITMADGARMLESVRTHTSSTLALTPSGISIITAATSGKAGKVFFTLGAPKAGVRKILVQGSTFAQKVRGSTVAKAVYFGTTSLLSFTMSKTTKGLNKTCVELVGLSTVRWIFISRSTVGINTVTAATACT
jgi:hypothetical protein